MSQTSPNDSTLDDDSEPPDSRRRMRPWVIWSVIAVAAITLILLSPVMVMQWRLRDVPAINSPIDLSTGGRVELPHDENAFVKYREANAVYVRPTTKPGTTVTEPTSDNIEETLEKGWESASESLGPWVDVNQPALDLWREGTERASSVDVQPEDLTYQTLLDDEQKLRDVARVAELKAARLQHEGKLAEAWEWHLATLRSSRHVGMHGCMISRLVGNAIYWQGTHGIEQWAADPRVTPEQLEQALRELKEVDAMTRPLSETLGIEYRVVMTTIETLDPSTAQVLGLPPQVSHPALLEVSGERELARRTMQMMFANYLSQCDRPMYDRTAIVPGSLQLRELDPSAPPHPDLVPPDLIESAFGRSVLAQKLAPAAAQVMNSAEPTHDARRLATQVTLAAQLYYREHGEFPESLEQLVGQGLDDVPIDPFGKGEPLRYRRDADPKAGAIVWSIGQDETDDGGQVEAAAGSHDSPPDDGLRIVGPGATPVANE